MDRLEDLPEKNTIQTPEEQELMKHFFGDKSSSSSSGIPWKKIAAIAAAFLLLANPVSATCLSKLPYCDGVGGFALRLALFIVLVCVVFFYL